MHSCTHSYSRTPHATGPSPTLTGMFQRTLQMKYSVQDKLTTQHRDILNIVKDRQALYFDFPAELDTQEEVYITSSTFT